jgi:hypothetical protein
MLVAELDDVTYDLEVDGVEVRRMVHRRVWERGAWATVAIVYEDRGSDGDWKPAKLALIRLQRVRGAWKKHAALTLHGTEAMLLCEVLAAWRPAFDVAAATEGSED